MKVLSLIHTGLQPGGGSATHFHRTVFNGFKRLMGTTKEQTVKTVLRLDKKLRVHRAEAAVRLRGRKCKPNSTTLGSPDLRRIYYGEFQ